jgi:hypothetical protein
MCGLITRNTVACMWGSLPKTLGLNLMLGLFLFDGQSDWIEGNYQQFVKPAVVRGNITAILIGNEDP